MMKFDTKKVLNVVIKNQQFLIDKLPAILVNGLEDKTPARWDVKIQIEKT